MLTSNHRRAPRMPSKVSSRKASKLRWPKWVSGCYIGRPLYVCLHASNTYPITRAISLSNLNLNPPFPFRSQPNQPLFSSFTHLPNQSTPPRPKLLSNLYPGIFFFLFFFRFTLFLVQPLKCALILFRALCSKVYLISSGKFILSRYLN